MNAFSGMKRHDAGSCHLSHTVTMTVILLWGFVSKLSEGRASAIILYDTLVKDV